MILSATKWSIFRASKYHKPLLLIHIIKFDSALNAQRQLEIHLALNFLGPFRGVS